uniref:Transposase n=1 Tax=Ascaris lumbricoides TaxID=6252 RepID=A0A0M3IG07_ASCLU
MRICSVDYPPEQSLIAIYSAYLTPILQVYFESIMH